MRKEKGGGGDGDWRYGLTLFVVLLLGFRNLIEIVCKLDMSGIRTLSEGE